MMKVSLIVTGDKRVEELKRFFVSLCDLDNACNVSVVFINQGNYDPRVEMCFLNGPNITIIHTSRCSLSSARNIGLKHVGDADIVGFPDDDCWYPKTLS